MEYIATSNPPGSVSHSFRCHFTSTSHESLVIVHPSSIEILDLLPTGPSPALTEPYSLYGRVLGADHVSLLPPACAQAARSAPVVPPATSANTVSVVPSLLVVLLDAPNPLVLFLKWVDGAIEAIETVSIGRAMGARESEFWQGVIVDRERAIVLCHVWTGSLTLLAMGEEESKKEKKHSKRRGSTIAKSGGTVVRAKFDVAIKALNLLSLEILSPPSPPLPTPNPDPTLLILSLSPTRAPILQSHTLSMSNRELSPTDDEPLLSVHVPDTTAMMLVSLPAGGVLVIGESELRVFEVDEREAVAAGVGPDKDVKDKGKTSAKRRRSSTLTSAGSGVAGLGGFRGGPRVRGVMASLSTVRMAPLTACEILDSNERSTRLLLGDSNGQIILVVMARSSITHRIDKILPVPLGNTSPPTSLTYLSAGRLFVGSHFGDSVIVSLLQKAIAYKGSFLSAPSTTITNLAPIVDFWRGDEGEVVTCSGGGNSGSLRIVRRGVGLSEEVVLEGLNDVEGIWCLTAFDQPNQHNLILVSTFTSTTLLSVGCPASSMPGDSEDVTVLPSSHAGFDRLTRTIAAGNCGRFHAAQVVKSGINIVSLDGQAQEMTWSSPFEVVVAAVEGDMILLGLRGGRLVSVKLDNGSLVKLGERSFDAEIAAVTLISGSIGALALWNNTVSTFHTSTLECISMLTPAPTSLPRSLIFGDLGGKPQLFIGLGDGSLVIYDVDPSTGAQNEGGGGGGAEARTISLGTTSVQLGRLVSTDGERSIFASCDRPAVLHDDHGRLSYSAVNLKNVTACAYLNTPTMPASLVLATRSSLIIGRINEMKKVHIDTFNFGLDNPYRITHHPSLHAYGVAFVKTLNVGLESESLESSFKVLEDDTFEPIFTFHLEPYEKATALETITLNGRTCFALGTGEISHGNIESQRGRVLLFAEDPTSRKVIKMAEAPVAGCVFAIAGLGRQFVTTCNSRVLLFDLIKGVLQKVSDWSSAYLPCSLYVQEGGRIVIGDAMSSFTLIEVDSDGQLQTVAKDSRPLWMTSVASLKEDRLIGADSSCNLLTMSLTPTHRLEAGGAFHVGEVVNRFRKGALVVQPPASAAQPNLLFATSSGRISSLITLDSDLSRTLFDLQRNMARVFDGPGGVTWRDWRDAKSEAGSQPTVGFIDGDLVERFLDIKDEETIESIMVGSNKYEALVPSYAELCGLIEGLRRLH